MTAQNIIDKFAGWKTYLVGIAICCFTALFLGMGKITSTDAATLIGIALSAMGLRHGMEAQK